MLTVALLLLLAPPLPQIVLSGAAGAGVTIGADATVQVGSLDCEAIRTAQFPEIPSDQFVAVGDACGPKFPGRPTP